MNGIITIYQYLLIINKFSRHKHRNYIMPTTFENQPNIFEMIMF